MRFVLALCSLSLRCCDEPSLTSPFYQVRCVCACVRLVFARCCDEPSLTGSVYDEVGWLGGEGGGGNGLAPTHCGRRTRAPRGQPRLAGAVKRRETRRAGNGRAPWAMVA